MFQNLWFSNIVNTFNQELIIYLQFVFPITCYGLTINNHPSGLVKT